MAEDYPFFLAAIDVSQWRRGKIDKTDRQTNKQNYLGLCYRYNGLTSSRIHETMHVEEATGKVTYTPTLGSI